jgi:tetratricopeptide (TPR) repeat protein
MPRQGSSAATSVQALATAAAPPPPVHQMAAGAIGQAGSRDALARLEAAMRELKALAAQPMLDRAFAAVQKDDFKSAADWALKALEKDERNGFGWYLLAIARERAGDFASSITCYESALALRPEHSDIANDLGRLAYRMGMVVQAEKLFRHFLAAHPNNPEGANNLACTIRDQGDLDHAIAILRPAILASPEHPMLWNTMGSVVSEQGDFATSLLFFEESLRFDPKLNKARYNRGAAKFSLGDSEGALVDVEAAIKQTRAEDELQMMLLLRSNVLVALGRIREGWDQYEARLNHSLSVSIFNVGRPRWEPGADLRGKTFLVFGEQGLGDEVLFANTLPDVIEDLGPDGQLHISVEQRLIPLFQRSFPAAVVGPHATYDVAGKKIRTAPGIEDLSIIDLWAPMGSLLRQYRPTVESYPERERFLVADPERVAHWREVLKSAPQGPKIGLLWKSAIKANHRHRFFSPFQHWAPVLRQPGVTFVNMQYGDCAEEIEFVRKELGVEIWEPPGIDLKVDLDDVAALSCALDLTIGFSNATVNLAAACGAPTWLISTPGAWPRLGTDRYPWYPQVRLFATRTYGEWDTVMSEVADALAGFAAASER